MRANLAKKITELQKIQNLLKNARKLVERELGRKVLDAYLAGKSQREIYELVRHIVSDVYGYDRMLSLKRSLRHENSLESSRTEKKNRKQDGEIPNENRTQDFNTEDENTEEGGSHAE